MRRKVLAWLLTLSMVFTMMPSLAFAADSTDTTTEVIQEEIIATAEDTNSGAAADDPVVVDDVIDTESELAVALEASGEVVLGGDIEVTDTIDIPAEVTVTLDLAGHNITSGYQPDSDTKHIYPLDNYGTLTIKDSSSGNGSISGRGIYNRGGAKLTINGAKVVGEDWNGGACVWSYGTGEVYLNNATMIGNTGVVSSEGYLEINGGTYTCYSGITDDGTQISPTYNIRAYNGLKITDGTFTSRHGVISVGGGTAVIEDGSYTIEFASGTTSNVVYVYGDSDLIIKDGEFLSDNTSGKADSGAAVLVSGSNAKLTINDGTFVGMNGMVSINANTVINGGSYNTVWDYNHYGKIENAVAEGAKVTVAGTTYVKTENGLEEYEEPAAELNGTKYPSLQGAVDAAVAGDNNITLLKDVTENVTITQKEGINIIIDGGENTFEGLMTVFGNGRQNGTETLKIMNVNFQAVDGATSCILSPDREAQTPATYSYAHNVTVEKCNFKGVDGTDEAAVRHGDGGDKNWTIKGCTVDEKMHSLLQVNNVVEKLTITDCTVKSQNGVNLNSCTNVEIEGCTFDVTGYAVRAGVSTGGNLGEEKIYVLKNNTLKSVCDDGDAVIMFRASAVDTNLSMEKNVVSGITHISGTTAATKVSADANYWDGANAPVVKGTAVEVETYYADAELTELVKNRHEGSGTEDAPYQIGTKEELFLFAKKVNDGTYKNVYAILTDNIDLEQEDWTSIGTSANPFTGTFDGNGKTISNIWSYESGLFGYTSTGNYVDSGKTGRATIKNLTVNGVEVYNQSTSAVGGVVGQAGQNTEIENVKVTGKIQVFGYGYVGALVGQGYVHVDNCHVDGVSATDSEVNASYWAVGGIVGHAGSEGGASITNCSVKNIKIYSAIYGAGSIAGVGTKGSIDNVTAENVDVVAGRDPDANGILVGCNYDKVTGDSTATNVTLKVGGKEVTAVQDMTAKVGNTYYATFDAAIAAVNVGDTITLLKDIEDAGKVNLPAGATLDGNGNTISGDSAVYVNAAGGTIKDTTFKNISNGNKLSAVYASNVSGKLTITGCTFSGAEWDSIQTTPVEGAEIVITDNVFEEGDIEAQRYVHIQSAKNVDFAATVTGNKMYEGTANGPLGCYYFTDADKVNVSGNYIEETESICILMNNGENVFEEVLPLMDESLENEIKYVAAIKSEYFAKPFETLQAAVDAAEDNDTVTVIRNQILHDTVTIDKNITLNLNGKTIKTAATVDEYVDAFEILADVTVTGEGKVDARPSLSYAFYVGNASGIKGNLTIESGKFYGESSVVQVTTGSVKINGGYFEVIPYEGSYAYTINCKDSNYNNGTATVVIKGGKFYKFNPADNAAEGAGTVFTPENYIGVDNGDGTYGVAVDPDYGKVAQIGDTKYDTLQAAVDAANAGDTITMLSDVTLDESVEISDGMDVIIAGEGKTITAGSGVDAFYVKGGKLTLSEGLNVHATTDCAIYIHGGEVITSANLTKAGEKYSVIQGNGQYTGNVTINGGKITNEIPEKTAIYWPQNGKLTINAGTITGGTAVRLSSGSLEINGGELIANGTKHEYVISNGGSVSDTGDALMIENIGGDTGYEAITSVAINGGTFKSENADAVASYAGGEDVKAVTSFISGGVFSSAVKEEYCADGYIPTENENGTYGVEEGEYVAQNNGVKYETLQAALDAAVASENQKVELIADFEEDTYATVVPAGVTLDLNGHYVTANNVLAFGDVIDTATEVGGIVISNNTNEAFVQLQPDNAGYLPIYDTTTGCYKFFEYELENLGFKVDKDNANNINAGVRVVFANPEGYDVLVRTGSSSLDIVVDLYWTGLSEGKAIGYAFMTDIIKEFAKKAKNQLINEGEVKAAMKMVIKGVNNLNNGDVITTQPKLTTKSNVNKVKTIETHTVVK